MLDGADIDKLVNLINDSFRVQPNIEPVYVELGNHLQRLSSPQHQVIFGRRGSGKSCLLVHFHRQARRNGIESVYINADIVKRLSYPDLLIRILEDLLRALPQSQRKWLLWKRPTPARAQADALKELLDEADDRPVSRSVATKSSQRLGAGVRAPIGSIDASDLSESRAEYRSDYRERKEEYLERHLGDFRNAIDDGAARQRARYMTVILDDFYLLPAAVQPDVVDYFHRLLRGTDLYLKIGTVRHRTRLVRYDAAQTIGIERRQDAEFLDLDQTFADVDKTRDYLTSMLNSLGKEVGINDASTRFLTADAVLALTLASGGVPRDYLSIFAEAVQFARAAGTAARITPKHIYKGAAREAYQAKLSNLRQDAGGDSASMERLFTDLLTFCLREKHKTAFLISQLEATEDPVGHDLIQQLMDFKFIHLVDPDTSAASGRVGRFEAYTLDFASFMEPRRRNIELVEFWKLDDQRRRKGLREAPVYSLARGRSVAEGLEDIDAGAVAESLDEELNSGKDDAQEAESDGV